MPDTRRRPPARPLMLTFATPAPRLARVNEDTATKRLQRRRAVPSELGGRGHADPVLPAAGEHALEQDAQSPGLGQRDGDHRRRCAARTRDRRGRDLQVGQHAGDAPSGARPGDDDRARRRAGLAAGKGAGERHRVGARRRRRRDRHRHRHRGRAVTRRCQGRDVREGGGTRHGGRRGEREVDAGCRGSGELSHDRDDRRLSGLAP